MSVAAVPFRAALGQADPAAPPAQPPVSDDPFGPGPPAVDPSKPQPEVAADQAAANEAKEADENPHQTPMLGVILDSRTTERAVVQSVVPRSPAANAGLSPDDEILEINGQPVESPQAVVRQIEQLNVGDAVELKIRRDDQERTLQVQLGARPERRGLASPVGRPWLGVFLDPGRSRVNDDVDEQPEEAQPAEDEGALIQHVLPRSPAAEAGLRDGDLITQFNGAAVKNSFEVFQQIEQLSPGDEVAITVQRGDETLEKTATLAARAGGFFSSGGPFLDGEVPPPFGPRIFPFEMRPGWRGRFELEGGEPRMTERLEATIEELREEIKQLREEVQQLRGAAASDPANP
jgi:membrane-associated protease RseP (regulator of RpoE activity)